MHREEQIFEQALEFPAGPERAAFLRKACDGDLSLELRVGQLLSAHESNFTLLDGPVVDPLLKLLAAPVPDICDESIGPYKLLELIGEGGMGLVYMAQQEHPVRRRVALKIIKPGMDTRHVIARFEAERRSLERLDHPGIARVLDAGITPAGRPYFVMELVRGISMTEFCDQAQLGTRERLELFVRVCNAVQHAHESGIIHRDLKPANILVTLQDGVPVPKIIDFGIAKATSGRLVDQTLFTNFLQMIGTPVYMSPEQAQLTSEEVDARSDTYSLGVVLYELLTGTTPFSLERLRSLALPEVQRILCEEEPHVPSSRVATLSGDQLSTIAARRNLDPRRYRHLLRGDLDWIVMRALEKDRNRRYQSARELADDVRRYLQDEPVAARRSTAVYRWSKLIRRYRRTVTAATVIAIVAAVVVLAGSAMRRADQARQLQEDALRQYAYVTDIQRAEQALHRGKTTEARDLLARHVPSPDQTDFRGFEWRHLWNRSDAGKERQLLDGHQFAVFDVTWSPSGKYLATAGEDHVVHIRDGTTGSVLKSITGFPRDVNAVVFSPDETLLAVTEEGHAVSFWDWEAERAITRIDHFQYPAARVFLTADPDIVVVTDVWWGAGHWNTSLCRISDGQHLHVWNQHRCLAVDPGGQRLLLRNAKNRLEFRDLSTPGNATVIADVADSSEFACFSGDGKLMVTGNGAGKVTLWQIGTNTRPIFETSTAVHGRDVCLSADGKRFAACGDEGILRVWNTESCLEEHTFAAESDRAWSCEFSPDGTRIAVARDAGEVAVYRLAQLCPSVRLVARLSPGQRALDLNGTGEWLAVLWAERHGVTICDTLTGGELGRLAPKQQFLISALQFAADDRTVWIGSETGEVRRVDLEAGSEQRAFDAAPGLSRIALSPDGTIVVTFPELTFWDAGSGAELLRLPGPDPGSPRQLLAFADAETAIVRIPGGHGFDIWHVRSRRIIRSHRVRGSITSFAVSPDRSLFAIGTSEPAIHLWDVESGTDRHTLYGHRVAPGQLTFSVDGRTLASTSVGLVHLSNVVTGQELLATSAFSGPCEILEFSQDGQRLFGVGPVNPEGGMALLVWEAATPPKTSN